MPSPLLFALALIGSGGLYLLLAGDTSTGELMSTGPVALASACLVLFVHFRQDRPLRLRAPWLSLIGRTVASLLADIWRVGVVLVRAVLGSRPAGAVTTQPFRTGGSVPVDAGRRGLVMLANSVAPNGIVLAPTSDNRLRIHRLTSAAPGTDAEWPV